MLCCYHTKSSIINTVIQKRVKIQFCQQNDNISVLSFKGENDLLFPAPMSQAILIIYIILLYFLILFSHRRADFVCFLTCTQSIFRRRFDVESTSKFGRRFFNAFSTSKLLGNA